jgi:hypothetical protein
MFLTWLSLQKAFMTRSFMVIYRPYRGKEGELLPAVKASYNTLRKNGYVTARSPHLMKAADDSVLILFEWINAQMKEDAQADPEVQKHWMALSKLCVFEKPVNLPEFQLPFPEFETVPFDE